jgi:hypothetical protein
MNAILPTLRRSTLVLLLTLLSACASGAGRPDPKLLDQTLDAYASAVRWNGLDATTRYIDPDVLTAHPPTSLELERLRQVEVANYQVVSRAPIDATHVEQLVDIELSNKNNQTVRTVRVTQKWQFDGTRKRWWLASGLPDITPK